MPKKIGNGGHGSEEYDPKTGKYVSSGSSEGEGEKQDTPSTPTLKLKVKDNVNFQDIINDLTQCSSVPFLNDAKQIEENIEKFFSKIVTEKIDSLYGKSEGCASYQFHPKSNPRMVLEIFPNVLGKYRYKDNHAHIISPEEFKKMYYSGAFVKIYRGISSSGEKAKNIVNNYGIIDLNNFDYYCPNGGNCYGSNIYTTTSQSYAQSYAGWGGTLIEGLLDEKTSRWLTYDSVARIMYKIDGDVITKKVSEQLQKNGLDQTRAERIAKSFGKAVKNDTGMVAILMGLDYYVADGHQRNLFNLSKWTIKEV